MSETDLRVVCRECGSEVSPYVTECPYCGKRIRKRAPKLEHHDDHFEPKPSAGARLRRKLPRLSLRRKAKADPGSSSGTGGVSSITSVTSSAPAIVPAGVILASALLLVVRTAGDLGLTQVGAISGDVGSEWWRFLVAQFAYDNVGYLFIIAVALALFATGLERRLGPLPALILVLGCGALGTVGAYGIADLIGAGGPLIAGGNGAAMGAVLAWAILARSDVRAGRRDDYDAIGVGVVVIVLLLLPLVESSADVFCGVVGGMVGIILGAIASRRRT